MKVTERHTICGGSEEMCGHDWRSHLAQSWKQSLGWEERLRWYNGQTVLSRTQICSSKDSHTETVYSNNSNVWLRLLTIYNRLTGGKQNSVNTSCKKVFSWLNTTEIAATEMDSVRLRAYSQNWTHSSGLWWLFLICSFLKLDFNTNPRKSQMQTFSDLS